MEYTPINDSKSGIRTVYDLDSSVIKAHDYNSKHWSPKEPLSKYIGHGFLLIRYPDSARELGNPGKVFCLFRAESN
jgi:hypothetical protein